MVQDRAQPLSGTLRLGVTPTVGPYLLPALLPRVGTEFPEAAVYLREDKTGELLKQLRTGQLGLLLLALPVAGEDLQAMALFDDTFVLAGEQLLLLDDGHCLRDQVLHVCSATGTVRVGDFSATGLNTLVQMFSNGLGITLMPALALDVELRVDSVLEVRSFLDPQPSRRIGLVWRRTAPCKSDFLVFAEIIQQYQHAAG